MPTPPKRPNGLNFKVDRKRQQMSLVANGALSVIVTVLAVVAIVALVVTRH